MHRNTNSSPPATAQEPTTTAPPAAPATSQTPATPEAAPAAPATPAAPASAANPAPAAPPPPPPADGGEDDDDDDLYDDRAQRKLSKLRRENAKTRVAARDASEEARVYKERTLNLERALETTTAALAASKAEASTLNAKLEGLTVSLKEKALNEHLSAALLEAGAPAKQLPFLLPGLKAKTQGMLTVNDSFDVKGELKETMAEVIDAFWQGGSTTDAAATGAQGKNTVTTKLPSPPAPVPGKDSQSLREHTVSAIAAAVKVT